MGRGWPWFLVLGGLLGSYAQGKGYDFSALLTLLSPDMPEQQMILSRYQGGLAGVTKERSRALPQLDLSLNYNFLSRSSLAPIPVAEPERAYGRSYGFELRLEQPLVTFGRLGLVWEMTEIEKERLLTQKNHQEDGMVLELIDRYGRALAALERFETLESTLKERQSILTFTEIETTGGGRSQVDLLRAQSQYDSARAEVKIAQLEYQYALQDLKVFLGREADEEFSLTNVKDPTLSFLQVAEVVDPPPSKELVLKEKQVALLERDVKLKKSQHYPAISLFASAASNKWDFPGINAAEADVLDPDHHDYMVGLQFQMNLFSGLRITGEHREAIATWTVGRTELEQMRRLRKAKLQKIEAQYRVAPYEYEAAKAAAEASNLAYKQASDDYKAGTVRLSELIRSEVEMRDAEAQWTSAWVGWLKRAAQLRMEYGARAKP